MARHLIMAAGLLEHNAELAHQHATSAARRAGRIGVVRETLAVTAYSVGDYQLALRELRTFRRITGSNENIALMVDCERALERPDRALEEGRTVDPSTLTPEARVALAIAMSGARLDQNKPELALAELQIPELDPNRAFDWSPDLFSAYAEVLGDLDRDKEAATWRKRARIASEAIDERYNLSGAETIDITTIYEDFATDLHADEEQFDSEHSETSSTDAQADADAEADAVVDAEAEGAAEANTVADAAAVVEAEVEAEVAAEEAVVAEADVITEVAAEAHADAEAAAEANTVAEAALAIETEVEAEVAAEETAVTEAEAAIEAAESAEQTDGANAASEPADSADAAAEQTDSATSGADQADTAKTTAEQGDAAHPAAE